MMHSVHQIDAHGAWNASNGGVTLIGMMPTHLIVLAVVVHQDRYLVVEERDGSFYLPAGKVEPGENLVAAVVRETIEEAGVLVGLSGILGFDHEAIGGRARLRFVFVGWPATTQAPKSSADEHSRGALWATREEIGAMRLRHPEVLRWIDLQRSGRPLLPCVAYETHGLNARFEYDGVTAATGLRRART